MPSFDAELSSSAARSLEKLGVTIWTDTRVTHIDEHGVRAGDEMVRAATVLWAAGVHASSLNAELGLPLDNAGRVQVGADLSIPGHREVFVIGDQALFVDEHGTVPGLAPAAIQQGRHAAANILADLRGHARAPFVYFDKGSMATIGRASAVVETNSFKLDGFLYLIGFRNRLLVFVHWMWSYVRYRRGARLITSREWMQGPPPPAPAKPRAHARVVEYRVSP